MLAVFSLCALASSFKEEQKMVAINCIWRYPAPV